MAVVTVDVARTNLVKRGVGADPLAIDTQRTFNYTEMQWQADQVDPHITTMNRKYLPASISGPHPDYDDTGHDLVDPTMGPEPPAGTIYQGVLGVALSGSYVGFNTGVQVLVAQRS